MVDSPSKLGEEEKSEVKPPMSDIVSFRVLVALLDKYKKDYDYCMELKDKGGKLVDFVDSKKLRSNQYIRFLEKKIEESPHKEIVLIMKKELKELN